MHSKEKKPLSKTSFQQNNKYIQQTYIRRNYNNSLPSLITTAARGRYKEIYNNENKRTSITTIIPHQQSNK